MEHTDTYTLCLHIPTNDAEGFHKTLIHPPSYPTHAVNIDTTHDTQHTHTCTDQTHNTQYTKLARQNMNGSHNRHMADIEHRLLTQNTRNAWHKQNTKTNTHTVNTNDAYQMHTT